MVQTEKPSPGSLHAILAESAQTLNPAPGKRSVAVEAEGVSMLSICVL